jgi:hypothetical protein
VYCDLCTYVPWAWLLAKGGVEQCCPLGVPSDRKCPQPGPYVKTVFASSIDDTCDAKAHVKAPHISTVDRGPDAQARARHGRLLRGAAAARLARPRGAHGLLAATSCSSDAIVLGSAPAAARRPAHDVWPLASSARLSTPSASTTTSGPSSPPTASLGGRCCAGAQRSAESRPDYRAPSPTHPRRPAHRAHTHGPKRPMAATNAAIQNSMQQLAATTRLGVKKQIYPKLTSSFRTNPQPQTVSLIPTPRSYTKERPY